MNGNVKGEVGLTTEYGEEGPSLLVMAPPYNEADGIDSVLERVHRVLQQRIESLELLVGNDGSDDETAAVAAAAGTTVISHPYYIRT